MTSSGAEMLMPPRERGCCTPPPAPALDEVDAEGLGALLRVLSEPVRLRIVEVLRSAPHAVCQCDLVALFDMEQPAMSKHLKRLVDVGLIASERRGLWAYYFLPEDSRIKELQTWLS